MDPATPPAPIDARMQERVRASFDRQGLMRLLGAELVDIAKGRVTIVLARRPEVAQQHGYIHAGATSSIADSAGGYAALTMFADGDEVLTVEYKLNLIAPAAGTLEAVGTVVKAGRTLTICKLEVFDIEHGRTLVAVGQQTLIRIAAQPASIANFDS
ncbi:MAG: PaaI family thioesterase [Kofleriaceae bacterium]